MFRTTPSLTAAPATARLLLVTMLALASTPFLVSNALATDQPDPCATQVANLNTARTNMNSTASALVQARLVLAENISRRRNIENLQLGLMYLARTATTNAERENYMSQIEDKMYLKWQEEDAVPSLEDAINNGIVVTESAASEFRTAFAALQACREQNR
jgi:hypothetical protein